jgi:hypothetical protein
MFERVKAFQDLDSAATVIGILFFLRKNDGDMVLDTGSIEEFYGPTFAASLTLHSLVISSSSDSVGKPA